MAPAIASNCHTLVLGSMPGRASLQAVEYYAHQQNIFWDIVETLFAIPRQLPYAKRLQALNKHGIGLWDVLAQCRRSGSLDSTITAAITNDFKTLCQNQPNIHTIYLNGKVASRYWQNWVATSSLQINRLTIAVLPSTSPANARISKAAKLSAWQKALAT